uniref:Cytochrome P450 2K1 n=1 Tax=Xenopus tropicalis TaxID=8364 RepID=A0A6I8PNU2_XENTR
MDFTFSLATYLVLVVTVLYILSNWKRNTLNNFPPGPKGWPLVGNVFSIDLKKPQRTYIELSKKYGPVFSVQMGRKKMVILVGYETVKDALVTHAEEFGGRAYIPVNKDLEKGLGITFSNGENWKAMRRFTITTLKDFGMGKSTIEEKITHECSYLVQYFASFKGKPFDNSTILITSVANIIVAILLGHRMEYEDPVFLRLLNLNSEYVKLLGSPMVTIYNMFPALGFLPGCHKTIERNMKELYAFVRRTFVEHQKNLDIHDQRSFIDAFLARQKEEAKHPETKSYFHNENLVRLVRNVFSAGVETTSTALRWALLLMIKYPDIQEKVHDEISRVIGSAHPTYSHRTQMPFTNAVIHEILRFADIVPLNVPHETTRDVHFKGYFIPKGTYIIPLLSSVLKDKTQFDAPEEFNPNHFLDSEGNFLKKEAFMPFSAGRRACPGEILARMELFIFFTSLLQKFSFRPPPGVTNINLSSDVGFTSVPLEGMICAIPRA